MWSKLGNTDGLVSKKCVCVCQIKILITLELVFQSEFLRLFALAVALLFDCFRTFISFAHTINATRRKKNDY